MADNISREGLISKFKQLGFGTGSLIEQIFAEGVYAVIDTFPAADVEPVRRWIPVSERLPGNASRCLVSRHDYVTGADFVDILWYDSGEWWDRQHAGDYAVTHWMPLPEPPKMDGGE